MAEHNTLTGSQLHEPKGIESALLGTVYVATGTGTGVWSDIAPSLQFIDAESDFAIQDGSSITLEAQTVYIVSSPITTAKYFTVQDEAVLTSINLLGPTLTYTGTGAMFRGTDASFTHRDMRVAAPNGSLYDFTDNVGGQKLFICSFVRGNEAVKFGTFNNMQTVLIDNSSFLDLDDGITITGANNVVTSINKFFIGTTSASCVGIELDATMSSPTIEINDYILAGVPGSIAISGAASNGNVPTGSIAQVTNCEFLGGATPLQNVTVDDIRWSFSFNAGLADTLEDGLVSLNNNATETVISAVSTPVKVAGTWVVERESKYSGDTTGRITRTGERDMTTPVDIVTTIEAASGTNKDIKIYLAVNGTVVANSGKSNRVSAADPKNTTVLWQTTIAETDYVEVFVSNESDTTNLIVKDAILRIN